MEKNNKFCTELKKYRIKSGLTQQQLAARIGVDTSYLSRIENGLLPPPNEIILTSLAEALNIDPAKLVRLSGRIPQQIAQELESQAKLKFGPKLKYLRDKIGISQQELAKKINADPSYISKLENGRMPPPSMKLLPKLANILKVKQSEFIHLAGKVQHSPRKNTEVIPMFRNIYRSIKRNMNVPKLSPLKNKGWVRVAISVLLVVSIASGLWLASPRPAQAVDFTFTPLSGGVNLGQTYQLDVRVNINSPSAQDILPIQRIDVVIENISDSSKVATLQSLPLSAVTEFQDHTIIEGSPSGSASILVTPGTNWGAGTIGGYRAGYGYGYATGPWEWVGYASGEGYGYGYAPYTFPTSITYTIRWTTPSGSDWAGTYRIKPIAYILSSGSGTWTAETPGTVQLNRPDSAPAPLGGVATPPKCEKNLSSIVDEDGVFTSSLEFECPECEATISIPEGTVALTEEGEPLSSISVTSVQPPAPPPGSSTIGINADFEPSGATFDPGITLTFEYNPDWLPPGATPENLTIMYYDESGTPPGWVELGAEDIEIDPVTNTITVRVTHFTVFSVMARTNPATFEVSGLKISPTSADVAEKVTISATVANTGDLAGSYEVVLKINGQLASFKNVSVAGGASEEVTFITVQGQAGSYSVSIDGLSATFTVTAVPTGPVVIAPSIPQVKAPEIVYPPSTAPVPPSVPAPVPAPTPWLVIIIVLVVSVIVGVILVWNYGFRRE